jgi:hypothetical protein
MTRTSATLAILTIAAVAAGGMKAAHAQTSTGSYAGGAITGLFGTGYSSAVAGSSSLITAAGASGGADAYYTLSTVPAGATSGGAVADPTSNAPNFPFDYIAAGANVPAWDSSSSGSGSLATQWDLPQGSGAFNVPYDTTNQTGGTPNDPAGYYIYSTSFNIANATDAANTLITLQAEVDNDLTGILVNGGLAYGSDPATFTGSVDPSVGDATDSHFSDVLFLSNVNATFTSGTNVISFIVNNNAPSVAAGNPVGLRIRIDGAAVPEPGSCSLALLGVAPVLGLVRRRHNSRRA